MDTFKKIEVVKDLVANITPVPGGVGVMTVTNVIQNIITNFALLKLRK